MTEPDTRWTAIEPGVLALPHTKLRITYVVGSHTPFRITWDGHGIPNSHHFTAKEAQRVAEQHMQELLLMGLEP